MFKNRKRMNFYLLVLWAQEQQFYNIQLNILCD